MEFDKSRVYTSLNADELKPGSKVIVADSLCILKTRVEYLKTKEDEEYVITTIKNINDDNYPHRFVDKDYDCWNLAYLISEPEEKNWIVYLHRKPSLTEYSYYLTACRSDIWESIKEDYGAKTKLFEGTEDECERWYTSRRHLANVIAAWEDDKTIQYNSGNGWEDCCDNKPAWDVESEYRIKPEGLKWTDLKNGDIIRDCCHAHSAMVIGIDHREESEYHIFIGTKWLNNDDLGFWEKVE